MTNPQVPGPDPLLGADKRPAVSWKDVPVNQVKRLEVESYSREAQTTVFGSNPPQLAFWPGNTPGERGNPKMAVVYDVLEEGEPKSLWAPIPGALRTALAEAQSAAGQRIGPGGTLEVYISSKKDTGKGNPQSLYKAKYTPGIAAPAADPLAGGGTPAAATDPWSTPSTPAADEPPF